MTTLQITAAASPFDFNDTWPSIDRPSPASAHVFQTAELLHLWCKTIGKARAVAPLFLRIADDAGSPLMLLPIGLERRAAGVRVLTFLDGGVSDYNAPVLFANASSVAAIGSTEIWRALTDALPSFDVAALEKMPVDVLGAPNPIASFASAPHAPSGHVVPLTGTWRDYVRTRLHRAKDSRRKMARLREHGAVRLVVAKTQADLDRLFPILIAQKTRRYLDLNNENGFDRPGYRDYYRAVTSELFEPGVVHLSALEVGDDILATHWGLMFGDRFYSLMLAFAEHPLARYSPGRLLVEHLVEWCFARGLRAFDLGVGDMEWKQHFKPVRTPLCHLSLAANPLGWTYLEARKIRNELRVRGLPGAPPKAA